jgi:hypothetical protein
MNEMMYIAPEFADCFKKIGLQSIDDVFKFAGGENLHKENLASFRQRMKFQTENPKTTLFLKRYQNIPALKQIDNWFSRQRRISTMDCDRRPAEILSRFGINVPKTVAFGVQWQGAFEKRSFIITERVPNAESLEKKLPALFFRDRKRFIESLAAFVSKFHKTGFRHRDLYLCHIFCDDAGKFTLIDLNRVFKPIVLGGRFLVKDLAQLYYSSPGSVITKADRLRFYLAYAGETKLSICDRMRINSIKSKAKQMAEHDRKHNRYAPYKK